MASRAATKVLATKPSEYPRRVDELYDVNPRNTFLSYNVTFPPRYLLILAKSASESIRVRWVQCGEGIRASPLFGGCRNDK